MVLAVQTDQLANWESFSRSRELLSHHCSLAGCTRGLGRHQTGSPKQVEAMDVYLKPFIMPKNQTEKSGPDSWNKAVPTWSELDGTRQGGSPPPIGWLPSSFSHSPKGAWLTVDTKMEPSGDAKTYVQESVDSRIRTGCPRTQVGECGPSKPSNQHGERREIKTVRWTLAKSCGRVFSRKRNEAY